ncbi:MAG TPA: pitrilysin family protein, partial [Acidimicrobiales bacterium]|nr:pitrilysin family protein [Acidimicrobiales bacterium]
MTIRTTDLPGGARVVTESMPHARSVSCGFWVGVGARDEDTALAGTSHFLEHLLFKGTARRGAAEVAEALEAVGGEMNAYTTHEHTAFHTRLPAAELALGLSVLGEVFSEPALRGADVEAERLVILDELLMEEDSHEDRVHTLLAEARFPGHPLGSDVLGTPETITGLGRGDIAGFHREWYRPANLVVAAAGALEHDRVLDLVADHLARDGPVPPLGRRPPSAPAEPVRVLTVPGEQAHVAVGLPGLAAGDEDRYAWAVANQVLGGGTASRLFRSVREERGLAYSVYSTVSAYADAGVWAAAAACPPARMPEVLGLVHAELDHLLAEGITEAELAVATGYLAGSTALALEDSGSCMGRIATSLLVHGTVPPVAEVLDRYRRVGLADVDRVLARVREAGDRSLAVLGPPALT